MGKIKNLRLHELRDVFALLGECCELGADPIAWRMHMAEGLRRLLGGQVALYQELQPAEPDGKSGRMIPLLTVDTGWPTAGDRSVLEKFWARNEHHLCPWFWRRNFRRVFHPVSSLATFRRRELAPNSEWYRSEFFSEYVRKAQIDDALLATHDCGDVATHGIVIHRALGDTPFDLRHKRLLALFFRERAQRLGSRLACRGALSVLEFPPRLREVLRCLMEGDGEKQIARKLRISQHTVHYHVRELHRRFGVCGRGSLLADARPYWPVLSGNSSAALR
ncbi:MAG TPA: helix-turn-helix transcriptional regulator [Lacipirellulaceae bacterium]|jgi:hypothetical protein|nr:helix-turn-helix transcriptional regulator [Lacipirellulaceae bacterium]